MNASITVLIKRLWILLLLLFGSFSPAVAQHKEALYQDFTKLTYVTEDYPPGNYVEGGELKGIAVDLLLAAARFAGFEMDRGHIEVYSWARSYRLALNIPGYVVFSTSRTPEREHLFQWAGPIINTSQAGLMALKSRKIVIDSKEQLKKYRFGVLRGDVNEQLLKKLGVSSLQMVLSNEPQLLAKMLLRGRVDLWAFEPSSAREVLEKMKIHNPGVEQVYRLGDNVVYYAFHKDTPRSLVQSLQRALDGVKTTDEYRQILLRYGWEMQ
ncbi:substrate-binding periplasmic protein [Dongshaea marina]|uniref:substrate-binding periplasmic protein n=1 Tax=Dongshaea marina TaxID=2047966 RepID=UPI000D3E4149|nr:transporter substrate-binding domain-containing protein [Dongshaea marina]